jgi:hypothetical protein
MLLFEFSTKSNFLFSGKMQGKLQAYEKNLEKIESKFKAKAMVVFVLDIPKAMVERFVLAERLAGSVADAPPEGGHPLAPVFFTDYETFKKVPIGEQLTAPIYFWNDGKQYPLRKNV